MPNTIKMDLILSNPTERYKYWFERAHEICVPLLARILEGEWLQEYRGEQSRDRVSMLEAVARTALGLAPFFNTKVSEAEYLKGMVCRALDVCLYIEDIDDHRQARLEFGHLAAAFLRSPYLWESVTNKTKTKFIVMADKVTEHRCLNNNWRAIDACLSVWMENKGFTPQIKARDHFSVIKSWYVGDGHYGDGELFRHDYYNSFATHPMLFTALQNYQGKDFELLKSAHTVRMVRLASQLERLVMPDGRYPIYGRSAAYGVGNFHALAYAVQKSLFPTINDYTTVGGVGNMMTHMLQQVNPIGFYPNNGGLMEDYISTGSIMGMMFFFAPLALPPDSEFWTGKDLWTQKKIWTGEGHASEDKYLEPIPNL